jgi:uncharacterized Zn-binding protein involved in type VI secretion
MPQPAARQGDPVVGTDIHIVMVPSISGAVPVPTPHPFSGQLLDGLSSDVLINGRPAAVMGSGAQNQPPHLPIGGPSFQIPPTNSGTVIAGSVTVLVNGKPLARLGDQVSTCNDPVPAPTSTIVAGSPNVLVG